MIVDKQTEETTMHQPRIALTCALLSLLCFTPPSSAEDLSAVVERMSKVGRSASPAFSPDGKWVAFISSLNGIPQVWTIPVDGGFPRLVTTLEDPVDTVIWSPVVDLLVFSVAPGGGMNQQIYQIKPDGTGLRRLTDGGAENNWLGEFNENGEQLYFSSNRQDPGSMDVWAYDFVEGELREVVDNEGIGFLADDGGFYDSSGRIRAAGVVYRMANRGDDNLYLVDFESGKETLLTPHDPPGSFNGGHFGPEFAWIYLTSNAGRDLSAFGRISLGEEGAVGPIEILIERDNADLEDVKLSTSGGIAALSWNVAGKSELQLVDLKTLKTFPTPPLPAEILTSITFNGSDDKLALVLSGAAAPTDIWILDLETRKYRQLTHSPHAGVDLTRLVRPELVRYPGHDGVELSGWLYRPLQRPEGSGEPGPFVIDFHGGPEGQARPRFMPTYQALLRSGLGVFAPNVRGSSGFGKRFVNLDNGALRFDAIKDIEASARFLTEGGYAESGQLGIMGGSYGGYMVMAGLTWYPDLFAAGVNLFGVVNFETFFEHTEPWMAAVSKIEYGDPETQKDLLRELSPIHKIDQVKAPTLVLHGANDTNVPVVEAEQVVDTLKTRNIPVEYVLFPDEGHGFRKAANRTRAVVEVVEWFDRYLRR